MYSGQTNYKGNGNATLQDTRECIKFNDGYRTFYNVYGFCLYTIQSFRDTYNRFPDLIIGSSDYNWCYENLRNNLFYIRNIGNRYLSGYMFAYKSTADGRYDIHTGATGTADSIFFMNKIRQPSGSL